MVPTSTPGSCPPADTAVHPHPALRPAGARPSTRPRRRRPDHRPAERFARPQGRPRHRCLAIRPRAELTVSPPVAVRADGPRPCNVRQPRPSHDPGRSPSARRSTRPGAQDPDNYQLGVPGRPRRAIRVPCGAVRPVGERRDAGARPTAPAVAYVHADGQRHGPRRPDEHLGRPARRSWGWPGGHRLSWPGSTAGARAAEVDLGRESGSSRHGWPSLTPRRSGIATPRRSLSRPGTSGSLPRSSRARAPAHRARRRGRRRP